jgi:MFS family permease
LAIYEPGSSVLPAPGGDRAVSAPGLRARIGLLVILFCVSFNILLVIAPQPALSTIAIYFGGGRHGQLIAQLLETMSGIGIMVGAPAAGWLSERIGRRRLLLSALGLYGFTGTACMFLDYAPALLTLRLFQGLGSGGIAVSIYSLVSDRFEGAARSRIIGYQGAFVSAMGIVSMPIAGAVAKNYGWHAPFSFFALALVVLLIAIPTVQESRPATVQAQDAAVPGFSFMSMVPLFLLIVPIYLLANMVNLHISFVLAGDGMNSPLLQSYIMEASPILYMVGGLSYGRLFVRLGAQRMLTIILVLMSASGLAIGLSHGAALTAIGVGLSGLASGFLIPMIANLVVNKAPPVARSRAVGFMYTAMYIGNFLNPLIMTPARQYIGNHPVFLICGLLLAAGAVAQWTAKRPIVS